MRWIFDLFCDMLFKASQLTMDAFYLFCEMFFKASHWQSTCDGYLICFVVCFSRPGNMRWIFDLFCGMFFKASQHAMVICSKVGSLDIFNQCLKRVVWGRFRDYCIKDTCANSTSYVPLCSMMSALAHECTEAGEVIDWMSDPTLQQYCNGIFICNSIQTLFCVRQLINSHLRWRTR